jgi:thymidylate kinase
MIIFIEGPRHSGKTHLLDEFFKQNQNPDIIYYKFLFAKYIDYLEIRDHDSGPGVHYFSIANVLTILELNKTILKDKILVFDRSIFSAYVWSIYRKRLDQQRLLDEFEKILKSDLYMNCALVYLTRKDMPTPEKREKDYFSNFENYEAESSLFNLVIDQFSDYVYDPDRGNRYMEFTNHFNEISVAEFNAMITNFSEHALNFSNK